MAKLHPAQFEFEQVLCESSQTLRRPRQRQLLDAGPQLRGCVHRRNNGKVTAEINCRVEKPPGCFQENGCAERRRWFIPKRSTLPGIQPRVHVSKSGAVGGVHVPATLPSVFDVDDPETDACQPDAA